MPQLFVLWLAYCAFCAVVVLVIRAVAKPLDVKTILLSLVLPVLFVLPGFTSDRTPVPTDHIRTFPPWGTGERAVHNPTLNDVVTQFLPWSELVRQSWRNGTLPLWNRWNGCGYGLAANGTCAAWSPINVFLVFLPPGRGFVLLGACKLFCALVGMALYARQLGMSSWAARLSAISFALSFAITPWLYNPATSVIALWPWGLWLTSLIGSPRTDRRHMLLLVVLFAVWPLMGHIESVALGALLCMAAALFEKPIERGATLRHMATVGACGVLGAGAAGFSLIPQWIAIKASNRLALALDPRHLEFVPWVPYRPGWLGGFLTVLFPRSFGDGIDSPMIPGAAGSITEMGFGHCGLVAVSLALLCLRRGSQRNHASRFAVGLVVFGLFGALGLPPVRQLVDLIPGIRLAPPLRLLTVVSLAVSVLAGLELDRLAADRVARAGRALAISGTLLGSIALLSWLALAERHAPAGSVSQREALIWAISILSGVVTLGILSDMRPLRLRIGAASFAGSLVVLACLDLGHAGTRLYRFYPLSEVFPATRLVRFLRAQPGVFRVLGEGAALFPNTNVFAGMEEIRTHDPAERRDFVEFLNATCGYAPEQYFKTVRDLNCPALAFLNVRYLISAPGRYSPGPQWTPVYAGADGTVFQNAGYLPRFFSPEAIQTAVTPERALSFAPGGALGAFIRDPHRLLHRALLFAESPPDRGADFPNPHAAVGNIVMRPDGADFDVVVDGQAPSTVVGSLVNDGGLSATADGKPLRTFAADGIFLGIRIPAGAHRVSVRYAPPGLRLGIGVSLAAILLAVMVGSRVPTLE